MRLVIDKDFSEIKQLNESYLKTRPTYTVLAVEGTEKFIYGKNLKNIREAKEAVESLSEDKNFTNCRYQIVESRTGKVINEGWLSNAGNWLKNAWEKATNYVKNLGADVKAAWTKNAYITQDDQLTGLGYKVATQPDKVKGDKERLANDSKNLKQYWQALVSQTVQFLKKSKQYKTIDAKKITGFVKDDKAPVMISAEVVNNEGDTETIMLTQSGDAQEKDADGKVIDGTPKGSGGQNGTGNNPTNGTGAAPSGNAAKPQATQITSAQAAKEPAKAVQNFATRLTNVENEVEQLKSEFTPEATPEKQDGKNGGETPAKPASQGSGNNDEDPEQDTTDYGLDERGLDESYHVLPCRFNGKVYTKEAFEHQVIKSFFNKLNDESVNKIVLSVDGKKCVFETKDGSKAYKAFKEQLKEATGKAFADKKVVGFVCESKNVSENPLDRLNGFKLSDFGDESVDDGYGRMVTFKCESTIQKPSKPTDKKETTKVESTKKVEVAKKVAVNEGFSLDLGQGGIDTKSEIEKLLSAMGKFASPIEKIEQTVATNQTDEVVQEADGDDASGGDAAAAADPFADDGGGDDAAGDADPFADATGGDGGGDDAGGDGGGGDDAGGDDAGGGDDAAAGDDAGAEGGGADDATGEPAPDAAINTDAQGEPQSQYNINVTKAFNSDDNFQLNDEEQKEFFGKIDQLVKIPDMENYSLYLYQITPENLNLDDVHYIQSLYDLSVKLGLLEDVYADSNLLDKYNNYKYSVMKDGENGEGGEEGDGTSDGLQVTEGRMVMEAKDESKDAEEEKVPGRPPKNKPKKSDLPGGGAKDTKLKKDKNGVDIPVIIDTTKEGWGDKKDVTALSHTMDGAEHGLGWLVTFKAMQFGSPRYMTMYIKKDGNAKKEKQCEDYLKRLSYTDIEFVHIEDVDPYDYIAHNVSGMKTPETLQSEKYANEKFNESTSSDELPKDIKKDVTKVFRKLNAEIRGTKQFNFIKECGIEKPQVSLESIISAYTAAKFDEASSETTYKFILRKNDSTESRMFYSNLKDKLFGYLGTFATRFNLEFSGVQMPTMIELNFTRKPEPTDLGYEQGELDTPSESPVQNVEPSIP